MRTVNIGISKIICYFYVVLLLRFPSLLELRIRRVGAPLGKGPQTWDVGHPKSDISVWLVREGFSTYLPSTGGPHKSIRNWQNRRRKKLEWNHFASLFVSLFSIFFFLFYISFFFVCLSADCPAYEGFGSAGRQESGVPPVPRFPGSPKSPRTLGHFLYARHTHILSGFRSPSFLLNGQGHVVPNNSIYIILRTVGAPPPPPFQVNVSPTDIPSTEDANVTLNVSRNRMRVTYCFGPPPFFLFHFFFFIRSFELSMLHFGLCNPIYANADLIEFRLTKQKK